MADGPCCRSTDGPSPSTFMSWHRPKIKIKALGIKSKVFKDYGLVKKKKKHKSSVLSSSSAKGVVLNPVSGRYDNPLRGKGVGWYG